jgi:hypothetical protein
MLADQGKYLFTLAVVVFLGWFAVGTQLNIRRGNAVLRWLQDGLRLLGEKTTLRWLGSSAVELKLQEPVLPLRWAQVFVVLEPRDVPFLWWFFRARGRRDLLIVRGQLRAMPKFELEALDRGAWSTRGIERELRARGWTSLETLAAPLAAFTHGGGPAAAGLLDQCIRGLALPTLPLVRVAVRQEQPNLEVQWRLRGFETTSSRLVLESLQRIVERLQEPPARG